MRRMARETSRTRALLLVLLLLVLPGALYGESTAAFVAASTRRANGKILALLLGADTTRALSAARALGRRHDPFVGNILEGLFSHAAGPRSYRALLVLRLVIRSVFLDPRPHPAKITANSRALHFLLSRLQDLSAPGVKRALLVVSRYLPASDSAKALLGEGAFLVAYLKEHRGHFGPERLSEALAFISACHAHDNGVLRSEIISLVELSDSAAFVHAARSYLAST